MPVFCFFYKQIGAFWFAKSKAVNFSFQDYFDTSICNFYRLAGQKTILIQSSCKFNFNFKLFLQHASIRFSSKRSLQANITERSLFNVFAKIQVANRRTLFF